jgi:RNA polymerase-binding transcription factor DksA
MNRTRKQETSKWTLAARILAERRAILGRLAAVDKRLPMGNQGHVEGDNTPTSDAMEAVQECGAQEFEFVSRRILVARLKTLARAEEKIREGSYGRCDLCEQPIAARLRAMPEAVRCVPCATARERESALA